MCKSMLLSLLVFLSVQKHSLLDLAVSFQLPFLFPFTLCLFVFTSLSLKQQTCHSSPSTTEKCRNIPDPGLFHSSDDHLRAATVFISFFFSHSVCSGFSSIPAFSGLDSNFMCMFIQSFHSLMSLLPLCQSSPVVEVLIVRLTLLHHH